jgi:hypothetical protein
LEQEAEEKLHPGKAFMRALMVFLVLYAGISFRAAPKILMVFASFVKGPWMMDFTSIIHWTLRYGLSKLNDVKPIVPPWLPEWICR